MNRGNMMNFLMSSDDNQKHFDYSLLSSELSEKLQNYDKQLNRIHQGYSIEVGEVLYNAQQEFSNPKDGNFIKWVEYKGFKSSNAYNYINIYKAFQSLESISDKEIFLEQSKSLQIEMSKPSAKPGINQMVYDGEITKHKDYIEREREFNEKEEKLNKRVNLQLEIIDQKNDTINKQSEEVRKLRQQEPQVVERTVEKFPEDYEKIKQENEQLKQSNQKLQRDLKWVQDDLSLTQTQYNLLESSTAEAKELERKIQSLQSQEKTIVEKMEAVETFYELESNFNDFFDTKMAPMRFKGVADHLYATNAVDRIRSMITQAELWAEEMNKILPNKNMKILEGEIIND